MPIIEGSFSPPEGIPLGRLGYIEFETLSAHPPVYATFADGVRELVWDGDVFDVPYARGSSVVHDEEANVFHFALRRVGGWPTSQVKIHVDDTAETLNDPYPILF